LPVTNLTRRFRLPLLIVADTNRIRGLMGTAVLTLVSIGLAVPFHGTLRSPAYPPTVGLNDGHTEAHPSIQIARALTEALNTHDIDALVELFTEEDAGPTVHADRFAWQKFEIRLWAQQQVAAGIWTDAYDYRATEHGATWKSDVYRADWSDAGIESVAVANSIWIHKGKLADFTSTLSDSRDLQRLGRL
jgi:hypothetical protein